MTENEKKQIEEMRKDLVEIFDEEYEKRRLITADNTAEKMTAKGYRKQAWISVEERLPTEQKEFLAYYGFDNGDGDLGMMYTGVLTYFAYDKKPHFQHEELRLRVTHWMPLPEAPKMKGGEIND